MKKNATLTRNAGMAYAIFRLSQQGWKVQRPDKTNKLILQSLDDDKTISVHVRTVRGREPVPMGENEFNIDESIQFVIVVSEVELACPQIYILPAEKLKELCHVGDTGDGEGFAN